MTIGHLIFELLRQLYLYAVLGLMVRAKLLKPWHSARQEARSLPRLALGKAE
jgi:hypothetical protein